MKQQSFLFATSAIIAFFATFSSAAESTGDANRFLDHIGIARGSSQSLTNEWALPQSVLVSNAVVSVSGERHFNHYSGTLSDTNATFVGTFEVDVSGSEAGSRTYWGLRQICRPLSPHLYYDFYDIDEIGGGLLLVWNTAVNDMGVTNRCQDKVSALYQTSARLFRPTPWPRMFSRSHSSAPAEWTFLRCRIPRSRIPNENMPA